VWPQGEERKVKRTFLAGILIIAFVTPALSETFYVLFDPASHRCSLMHSQSGAGVKLMKVLGKFNSEAEAKKAMALMKECNPG
jgi:hypothetical protein